MLQYWLGNEFETVEPSHYLQENNPILSRLKESDKNKLEKLEQSKILKVEGFPIFCAFKMTLLRTDQCLGVKVQQILLYNRKTWKFGTALSYLLQFTVMPN